MSTQQDKFIEIANAIRFKEGSSDPIIANDFAARILALQVGGGGGLPDGVRRISLSPNIVGAGVLSGGGYASDDMVLTISATPTNNYLFQKWLQNGEEVAVGTDYTFKVIGKKDMDFVAVFKEKPKKIKWQQYTLPWTRFQGSSSDIDDYGVFNISYANGIYLMTGKSYPVVTDGIQQNILMSLDGINWTPFLKTTDYNQSFSYYKQFSGELVPSTIPSIGNLWLRGQYKSVYAYNFQVNPDGSYEKKSLNGISTSLNQAQQFWHGKNNTIPLLFDTVMSTDGGQNWKSYTASKYDDRKRVYTGDGKTVFAFYNVKGTYPNYTLYLGRSANYGQTFTNLFSIKYSSTNNNPEKIPGMATDNVETIIIQINKTYYLSIDNGVTWNTFDGPWSNASNDNGVERIKLFYTEEFGFIVISSVDKKIWRSETGEEWEEVESVIPASSFVDGTANSDTIYLFRNRVYYLNNKIFIASSGRDNNDKYAIYRYWIGSFED